METTFPPTCWLFHRDVLYSPPPSFHFRLILRPHFCSLPQSLGSLQGSVFSCLLEGVLSGWVVVALLHIGNPYLSRYFLTPHLKAHSQPLGSTL